MTSRLSAERGSATIELAILAPVVVALLMLTIGFGKIAQARTWVDQAAHAAARSASLERDSGTASSSGNAAARQYLTHQGLECSSEEISVDTSGFTTALGQPAAVTATVTCVVPLKDIAGVPAGSKTFTGTATSPIDPYRERS